MCEIRPLCEGAAFLPSGIDGDPGLAPTKVACFEEGSEAVVKVALERRQVGNYTYEQE